MRRPALGGLLGSSHRQHLETLAAERERRRLEREERLQKIEMEERNRFKWVSILVITALKGKKQTACVHVRVKALCVSFGLSAVARPQKQTRWYVKFF